MRDARISQSRLAFNFDSLIHTFIESVYNYSASGIYLAMYESERAAPRLLESEASIARDGCRTDKNLLKSALFSTVIPENCIPL